MEGARVIHLLSLAEEEAPDMRGHQSYFPLPAQVSEEHMKNQGTSCSWVTSEVLEAVVIPKVEFIMVLFQ